MSEAMTTKDQLTAAIESVICDLWDEHPSTNLADRKKIEDAITPQFDDAYVAIAALEAQLEEVLGALREWIKENAPGGWIDNLRKSVAEKDAALQAAIQRAEAEQAGTAERVRQINQLKEKLRNPEKRFAALQARVGKLEEAVEKGLEWFHDPDENALAQFERIGDWFYREAGHLRPGKDDRMEDTSSPENRDRFLKWCHGKSRERLALFRAALASREGGEG